MKTPTLGALLYAFFENHLKAQKGLRPATIRSYRDAVRLFLTFVAEDRRCRLTRVKVDDLTARRVADFLNALETERHNHIRSRNQRLTALKGLFDYIAAQRPELWEEAERVMAIPTKRVAPPRTYFLERDEVETMFARMANTGPLALRDRTLLLFLYNTGARVQEVADSAPRQPRAGPTSCSSSRQGRQVAGLPAVGANRRAATRTPRCTASTGATTSRCLCLNAGRR